MLCCMIWNGRGSKWLTCSARGNQTHPLSNSIPAPKRPASTDETHEIGTSQSLSDLYNPVGGSYLFAPPAFSRKLHLLASSWNQRHSSVFQIYFGAAKEPSHRYDYGGSLSDDLLSGSTNPARRTGSSSGTGSRT